MAVFRQEEGGGEGRLASTAHLPRKQGASDHEVFLAPLCPFA
jgi:hypothetical protein